MTQSMETEKRSISKRRIRFKLPDFMIMFEGGNKKGKEREECWTLKNERGSKRYDAPPIIRGKTKKRKEEGDKQKINLTCRT